MITSSLGDYPSGKLFQPYQRSLRRVSALRVKSFREFTVGIMFKAWDLLLLPEIIV